LIRGLADGGAATNAKQSPEAATDRGRRAIGMPSVSDGAADRVPQNGFARLPRFAGFSPLIATALAGADSLGRSVRSRR
jgi:hypothetical protein